MCSFFLLFSLALSMSSFWHCLLLTVGLALYLFNEALETLKQGMFPYFRTQGQTMRLHHLSITL